MVRVRVRGRGQGHREPGGEGVDGELVGSADRFKGGWLPFGRGTQASGFAGFPRLWTNLDCPIAIIGMCQNY